MPRRPTGNSPCRPPALLIATILVAALFAGIGCGQSAAVPQADNSGKEEHEAAAALGGDVEPNSPGVKLLETWDSVYMADTKVGSIHTVFESIQQQGQAMSRVSSDSKLEFKRFDQSAVMQTRVVAIDTEQGAVRSFRTETSVGPTPITVTGTYRDGKLHLVTVNQGKQVRQEMPWSDDRGGFFALEKSLSNQPLAAGEKRTLTMLMPGITGIQVVTTTLRAQTIETTNLLDGAQPLLKIAMITQIGDQQLDAVCWTSPRGEVLKTSIPSLQQTIYRTTQQRAQSRGAGNYDLGRNSIVKVATPLPHPHQLTRAEYKLSLPDKDPSEVFASGGSQLVQSIDQHHARMTVLAVRPGSQLTDAKDPAPLQSDSEPNSLVQSDDPQIEKMAQQLVDGASDPWSKCLALEQGVHGAIQAKNFEQGFATASDVVRTLEGDCTEHAVLLAALCRAQGIPARVALGLVYSRRDQGFAFHMWNEAWIQDRWMPLDATLGLGGIGAAHLKLGHSSLAGEAAESAVLSVIQVINQLKIEILDFQPQ